MMKYLFLVFGLMGLTACQAKDGQYYRTHPKELQSALKACPEKKPDGISCEQLNDIGQRVNGLAYQLQANPQAFGSKILALQQQIAQINTQIKKDKSNSELQAKLDASKQELVDMMSIVKWLESPES